MNGPQLRAQHAPAEMAAHAHREAQAAEVARQCGQDLHHAEVLASHQGAPSPAVQDRTHGAGRPAVDKGSM